MYESAMSRALRRAHEASLDGDVPVGAVVVDAEGRVIGEGWNRREVDHDPTAHAEILALREAGKALGTWNLSGCTLVVTLEPCTMCAGAIVNSRVDGLVFGAWDEKAGACGSLRDVVRDARLNHAVEVLGGVMGDEVSAQLTSFFAYKRRREESEAKAARNVGPKHMAPRITAPRKRPTGYVIPEIQVPTLPVHEAAPGQPTEHERQTEVAVAKAAVPNVEAVDTSRLPRRSARHEGKPVIPPYRG